MSFDVDKSTRYYIVEKLACYIVLHIHLKKIFRLRIYRSTRPRNMTCLSQTSIQNVSLVAEVHHHHMALQPKSGPAPPLSGFLNDNLFTGLDC
jgi:hypothetical protein